MTQDKPVRFDDWLEKQLKDPEFRAAYEKLEPEYQAARRKIDAQMNTPEPWRTSGEIAWVSVMGCFLMLAGLAGVVVTILAIVRWIG